MVLVIQQLAAGALFSFLGVLLAVPLTMVVLVLVQRLYVRTLLGQPIKIGGEE